MDWEEIVLVLATSWVTLRLLGIGLNFEQLFDLLGMDGISDRIRAVKGWFLLPESGEQLKWVEEMNKERAYYILRTQQSLAIKDLTIEHAIQRKLDVPSNLWNTGPKDWKHKLLEMRCLEWIDRNQEFAVRLRKPEGPFIRQYERQQERKHKALAANPTKYLSQSHLVEECKTRDGCYEDEDEDDDYDHDHDHDYDPDYDHDDHDDNDDNDDNEDEDEEEEVEEEKEEEMAFTNDTAAAAAANPAMSMALAIVIMCREVGGQLNLWSFSLVLLVISLCFGRLAEIPVSWLRRKPSQPAGVEAGLPKTQPQPPAPIYYCCVGVHSPLPPDFDPVPRSRPPSQGPSRRNTSNSRQQ
ncbi:hypothetical protein A7D00_3982 [Trichophyton violaceum]|uniref:Uncharacterized protein n=1 Tax=Trichophyton violaceum TaxID=34388 RepID=A0A178FHD1_TRIVO|nr:hypothetical protein A7D00_3982 [Trichophyton violaceum]